MPTRRARYLDGGSGALAALDDVAAAHSTTISAVALAWLLGPAGGDGPDRERPRRPSSSRSSCRWPSLELDAEELDRLSAA